MTILGSVLEESRNVNQVALFQKISIRRMNKQTSEEGQSTIFTISRALV